MKLIDFLNDIEVDEAVFNELMYSITDTILVRELHSFRERRIDDYLTVKQGQLVGAYVFGNLEQDAIEIAKRIEAVDMVLEDYSVKHEPYDFSKDEELE
jgi:hypothetical protein